MKNRTVFGWASASARAASRRRSVVTAGVALALSCGLGVPRSAAARAELQTVHVLRDEQGGAGRAVELEFSEPIEMSASRFYVRDVGARDFVRAIALPRDAGSPTRVFLVISPDAGPALEIRWSVRCADGHLERGEHSVRFAQRRAS